MCEWYLLPTPRPSHRLPLASRLAGVAGWRVPAVHGHVTALERLVAIVVEHLQLVPSANIDAAIRLGHPPAPIWVRRIEFVFRLDLEVLEFLLRHEVVGPWRVVGHGAIFDRPFHRAVLPLHVPCIH